MGAHLLPGAVVGTSIQLAGAVSSRLLALVLVMLVLLWIAYSAIRFLLAGARGGWQKLSDRLPRWAGASDGLFPNYLRSLLDERKPEAASLALSAILLLAAAWGFFAILDSVASNEALVQFDRAAYALVQGLRSPSVDAFFVTITR